MKNFQIFNSYEREKIKAIEKNIENSYVGFIYILEYGKNIKIGYSKNPVTRIKSFKNQAEYGNFKLGNVAISKPHTNYRENEKLLHQYFKQYRIAGTELFSVTLKQALSDLPNDLKFLDESERLTQKEEQCLEEIKKFISVSEITTSHNDALMQIIEKLELLERKIDMLESKSDNIIKTLFDISDILVTNFNFLCDKLFGK